MRRAVLLTAILMIVFLVAPSIQMVAVKANPYHEFHVGIWSPSSERTYTDSTVDIEVCFSYPITSRGKPEVSYSIDGSENKTLDITSSSMTSCTAKGPLYNLTNGSHSIKAYAGFPHPFMRSSVDFVVDTSFTYPTFLQSPRNITYNSKEVPLEFITNQTWDQWGRTFKVQYTLDKSYEDITEAKVNTTITGLTDGQHKIIVDGLYVIPKLGIGLLYSTKTIYFTIDTISPKITVLSIENKTYSESSIPLKFNASENTAWIAYNLDNQGNTTVQGNVTLSKLSNGSHSIIIYANDAAGNSGLSQLTFFSITPSQTSTPSMDIGIIVIIALVVAVITTVVFIKKKQRSKQCKAMLACSRNFGLTKSRIVANLL